MNCWFFTNIRAWFSQNWQLVDNFFERSAVTAFNTLFLSRHFTLWKYASLGLLLSINFLAQVWSSAIKFVANPTIFALLIVHYASHRSVILVTVAPTYSAMGDGGTIAVKLWSKSQYSQPQRKFYRWLTHTIKIKIIFLSTYQIIWSQFHMYKARARSVGAIYYNNSPSLFF